MVRRRLPGQVLPAPGAGREVALARPRVLQAQTIGPAAPPPEHGTAHAVLERHLPQARPARPGTGEAPPSARRQRRRTARRGSSTRAARVDRARNRLWKYYTIARCERDARGSNRETGQQGRPSRSSLAPASAEADVGRPRATPGRSIDMPAIDSLI